MCVLKNERGRGAVQCKDLAEAAELQELCARVT